MRVGQGFSFNGLIFNNEMAYEIISEIEGGLDNFYDDNIQLFCILYKERIGDYYQYINNLINDITSELKVVEIEAGEFVKYFPNIVILINCGGGTRDSILRKYEKDLLNLFCQKVEIIFKND